MLKGFADEISSALDADEMRRRLALGGEGGFEATFAEDIQRGLMPGPSEDLGTCEAGFAVLNNSGLGGGVLRLARLGDGSHAVLAGRVSGTGAPAALVAVKIGEAFRLLAPSVRGAAELLQALGKAAAEGLRHEMRASAAVLVLSGDGSLADVALAGSSCMGLGAPGAAAWHPDEGRSLGVHVPGASPAPPATTSARLDPGDGVLLLTSGCLNARSPDGERYGSDRVEAFALANADRAADEFAGALAADIERFRAGAARVFDGAIAFVRRRAAA
jgi:serine phosphatase RsbU (regulator of sigma subunit)